MRIVFHKSGWNNHTPNNCLHGPQTWPWYKPMGFLFCKLGTVLPTTGYRLWIYFRKWKAIHFDIVFDRRGKLW